MSVSKQECNINITLTNQDALENVQNFNYLGSTISRSGDMSPELNNRLGRAASTFSNLLPIMRQKSIRLSTKLAIYRAAVITTLLYGAEAWNTTVAEEKRLAAFHTRCLRRILGVSWHDRMTNEEVFDRTGDTSLIDYLCQKRLRWLGHVVRMSPERLPSLYFGIHVAAVALGESGCVGMTVLHEISSLQFHLKRQ